MESMLEPISFKEMGKTCASSVTDDTLNKDGIIAEALEGSYG